MIEHGMSAYASGKCRCEACRAAWRDYMRAYRSNPAKRQKANARSLLRAQVVYGKMTPEPCEVCGTKEVQAHHDDYSDALGVRWLCREHHKQQHSGCGLGPSVFVAA